MANTILDTLLTKLNVVGLQTKQQPLYDFLANLLKALKLTDDTATSATLLASSGGGGSPGSVSAATVLTVNNEIALFPNSRQELAGTNISFDDTVPNIRTINSTAASTDYVVMGDGVQPPTAVNNGAGEFVYTPYSP